MIQVSKSELYEVASISNSTHLAFFTLALGTCIAIGMTLKTVQITDQRDLALFWGLFFASLGGSVYFGVRAFFDYKAAKRKLVAIEKGETG